MDIQWKVHIHVERQIVSSIAHKSFETVKNIEDLINIEFPDYSTSITGE